MARTAEAIIDEVLALPERERTRVLDALVDAVAASEIEQDPAFMGELRRRADAALSGEVQGVTLAKLRAQLHADSEARRARSKSA
ncbi:MAG: addiction module protein [Polyangiaceae bacterium]|nr:addiction module protein [Polyangiaceae bacterium]